MNELSLFSGIGGGLLASRLLGWRCVGYVECDDYCQRVLRARIDDGYLDRAPIFGDVRAFTRDGYASIYRGLVDVVTAGFPCQPFSLAGKRLKERDDRNMWPDTLEVVRVVRPRFVCLENVPGVVSYLPVVRDGLRELGYCVAAPLVASAAIVGAGHIRRRLWIIAHRDGCCVWIKPWRIGWTYRTLAAELGEEPAQGDLFIDEPGAGRPNSGGSTAHGQLAGISSPCAPARSCGGLVADPDGERELEPQGSVAHERGRALHASWWASEPGVERVVLRSPDGMDRNCAVGNCQVPRVAALAWRLLMPVLGRGNDE